MKFLRKFSLQRKQMFIVTVTSGIALLLTCLIFAAFDFLTLHRTMVRNLSTMAEIVGDNSTAALEFNDRESAAETLSALRADLNIEAGCIFDKTGQVFAAYNPTSANSQPFPVPPADDSHFFKNQRLHIFRQIVLKNEVIGMVYVRSDLGVLYSRLQRYGAISCGVFLAASLVSLLLSARLQKLISGPILELVQMTRTVAREKNYSLRAKKESEDELGVLVENFNEMLSQIQLRDAELQNAKDVLEMRVGERTKELASSLSLIRATLQSTADGILVSDNSGKVSNYNENFIQMWGIPREIADTMEDEKLLEVAMSKLKNPEQFLAKVKELYGNSDEESFDLIEFKDGRVFERYSKPQQVGDKKVGRVWSFRDITERKRAEAKLRRTEELYRGAISGVGAVPYSYDHKTKTYSFMGEGIEQLLGYPPHEVTSELWKKIIQESVMVGEAAGLDKSEAARRVGTGEVRNWRCDMRVITKDGHSKWISDASVQNLDENGRPVGSMGILQDITERKQAEISAIAFSKMGQNLSSAASLKEAADVIGDVVEDLFGWDAFWLKLYNSQRDEIYSEFTVDTVDGKRVTEQRSEPRPPSGLYRRILESGAELILRDNPAETLPGAIPFGNTTRPSASIMFVPIRSAGRVVGIFSVQSYTPKAYTEQDLATLQMLADQCGGAFERIWADEARHKSESQFRLVWNSSADGMRLADKDGMILTVNDAFCQMVGKTEIELTGKPVSIIHTPDSAARILRRHREQVATNTFLPHLEKEVSLWNGKKIWFELSNSLLQLPGQPPLLLSIFRDITLRKKAEAEMTSMHTQLLETSRQAGMAEVATSVLHNVGNVLNSVNVSGSVIRDKIRKSKAANLRKVAALFNEHDHDLPAFFTGDPRGRQLPGYLSQLSQHLACEQQEVLDEVNSLVNNIEHIKEIVTMQQSYAKVSGVSEMLQVEDMIEDALRMNAGALERHQVRVIREFSKVSPILVQKHKLLQILVNLIRNAKHALEDNEPGNKEIRLRVEQTERNSVLISVIDNGVGIPPENLTRIFAHGFTTRKNGHGFGLHSGAIAAREMGGALIAQSEGAGKGATFSLELPYQKN